MQQLKLTLLNVHDIMNVPYRRDPQHDDKTPKWFLCFGALLYVVRDRMVKEFDTDLDIGCIYGKIPARALVDNFSAYNFKLVNQVVNDRTGEPFQLVFENKYFSVDVFFWYRANGYYWHTGDLMGKRPKNGILKEYIFKGTPEEFIKKDTVKFQWFEEVPYIPIPKRYGSLLDIWYPPKRYTDGRIVPNSAWFIPDRNYGMSQGKTVKLKTCKHMDRELR